MRSSVRSRLAPPADADRVGRSASVIGLNEVAKVRENRFPVAFASGFSKVKKGCSVRSLAGLAGNARVKSNAHAWTFRKSTGGSFDAHELC